MKQSEFTERTIRWMVEKYMGAEEGTVDKIQSALLEVECEVLKASGLYPPFNSAHEGYAVLAEEVDELWDHVKVKQGNRNVYAMRKEAMQVAAMAIRFMVDISHERGQR